MQAFEQVYVEHFQAVYRFVLKLCGDAPLAEEITEEAFFKALTAIDQFEGRCSVRAWLIQIAKNEYFSHVRKRRFFHIGAVPDRADERDGQASDALIRAQSAASLHRALHGLAEPYKEVFSLRVFAELPYAEISRLFEKSESWARVTYHRAKRMILDQVKEGEA